jgi:hypothetical protein
MSVAKIVDPISRDPELRRLMQLEDTGLANEAVEASIFGTIAEELSAVAAHLGIANLALSTTTEHVVVSFR